MCALVEGVLEEVTADSWGERGGGNTTEQAEEGKKLRKVPSAITLPPSSYRCSSCPLHPPLLPAALCGRCVCPSAWPLLPPPPPDHGLPPAAEGWQPVSRGQSAGPGHTPHCDCLQWAQVS